MWPHLHDDDALEERGARLRMIDAIWVDTSSTGRTGIYIHRLHLAYPQLGTTAPRLSSEGFTAMEALFFNAHAGYLEGIVR